MVLLCFFGFFSVGEGMGEGETIGVGIVVKGSAQPVLS